MKVVHICISERFIENQSYQENLLAARHVQMGLEVYLIAANRYSDKNGQVHYRDLGTYINKDGVTVTILPPMPQWRFTSSFTGTTRGLYNRLSEISPDIIMVHGVSAKENSIIARYISKHPDVRLFVDNHNDYYNSPVTGLKRRMWKKFDSLKARKLLPYAQKYWGTIPWRVQYLQDTYKIPADKTDLLIMGADEKFIEGRDKNAVRTQVRGKYQIPKDAFLVVTGGTLDKRKQQNLLFDAVKDLSGENVWLIAFGTPTKEMEPVFAAYKNIPNIVMTGWLPAEQAYDMFMASDLAFFPGTHSVLWEQAVACATPLAVQHWGGMEHVNVNGNAILLDDVNVQSIKATIQKLNKTQLYQEMKDKAGKVAPQFYLTEIAKKAIGLDGKN